MVKQSIVSQPTVNVRIDRVKVEEKEMLASVIAV